ncbi:hypothetical protein Y1Q_0010110 [Alligator mississippiensis]|uniref:DDE Tnp4 domain-containing protein n=1 Tax=Alligator mississippiensis TaxID=8496 RepID=A0A151MGB3_ALLMI|nr:hypothetical protein Y1Q_0010110 [Alligator mississippiensis]
MIAAPFPGPRWLLLATLLTAFCHHCDHHLAWVSLGHVCSLVLHGHVARFIAVYEAPCLHANATETLDCHPDSNRDANDMQVNTTTTAIHELLGLQVCCLWAYPGSQKWWLHIIQCSWDNEQWLDSFCMTWATFQELLNHLCLHLEQQATIMQPPFPTQDQLATSARLCYISHLFSMVKATPGEAILEVCGTLQDVLGHTMLQTHNPLEMVARFHALGFTQGMGSLDGIHILISWLPHGDHHSYRSLGIHSIMLQVIDNHQDSLTSVSPDLTGSVHNAHIFQNSALPALVENRCFLPCVPDLQLSEMVVLGPHLPTPPLAHVTLH